MPGRYDEGAGRETRVGISYRGEDHARCMVLFYVHSTESPLFKRVSVHSVIISTKTPVFDMVQEIMTKKG